MSLQLWLPLVRNLNNQGLSSSVISSVGSGVSLNDNGKLGKCYYFDGTTNGYMLTDFSTNVGIGDFSIALWVKIPTITSGSYFTICSSKGQSGASAGLGIYWNYSQKKFLWSTSDGTATEIWQADAVDTIVYDKWIHLVMVRESADAKHGYFYINGIRYELASVPAIRNITASTATLYLGKISNGAYPLKMYLNDFRFYNHALSTKEIKEISKGLVCHYQLNNAYSTSNLVPNGNGAEGARGWSSSTNISTTEIPPDQTTIKASYYGANHTSSYIPISHDTTYTLSVWLKATQATGSTYPSLLTYDADKKWIGYQNAEGFSQTYVTTLAQPLHKGDTVVYATDLSAWTTDDNYWNYCAIFGYKDSFGTLYPDLKYTADAPAFASKGSTKTHINKTNNTITLNSAFTGADRPAGTTICQATAGSTYVYPWGAISASTIQDWTFKTTTINPLSNNRLRYARYVDYLAYQIAYHAGITLTDDGSNNIVYDCSGYNYHGTPTNLTISSDTPRNSVSTSFNGIDSIIVVPFNTMVPTGDNFTLNLWFKKAALGSKNYETLFGGPSGFEMDTRAGSSTTLSLYMASTRGGTLFSPFNLNEWYMVTLVNDGTNEMYYVNGELKKTIEKKSMPTGTYRIGAWNSATGQNYYGLISDFRIYGTPLSADDVKALYNTPVSISNTGAVFTQGEFVEV